MGNFSIGWECVGNSNPKLKEGLRQTDPESKLNIKYSITYITLYISIRNYLCEPLSQVQPNIVIHKHGVELDNLSDPT